MASARAGDGLLNSAGRETAAEPAPRTLTEPGALAAPLGAASGGHTSRPQPAAAGSAPGSVNADIDHLAEYVTETVIPAFNALHEHVKEQCSPFTGLSPTEMDQHTRGIARVIGDAKGWDRIRAEYGDVRAEARQRAKRPCLMCDRPTTAISQVCTRPDCPREHA